MDQPNKAPASQATPAINAMEPRKRRPDGRMPLPTCRPGAKPIKTKPYVNRRHYFWTAKEVYILRKHLSRGMRPKAIATLMGRSPPSVISKIWRLKTENQTREAATAKGDSEPTASASSSASAGGSSEQGPKSAQGLAS
ncbi:hypothetical protein VSDG_05349 [Cytospora chrysosperma]|uniref:Uncharacterized protein n=1 Tax=Cytospora chrysosperma TaxID=252740 RepID=A0A423VWS2_CYTCH|nr:hypothetical protein VSDG_05349 [Valsa sordida]